MNQNGAVDVRHCWQISFTPKLQFVGSNPFSANIAEYFLLQNEFKTKLINHNLTQPYIVSQVPNNGALGWPPALVREAKKDLQEPLVKSL